MAEASLMVYGAVIGIAICLSAVAFTLRQRRPHGPEDIILDEDTT